MGDGDTIHIGAPDLELVVHGPGVAEHVDIEIRAPQVQARDTIVIDDALLAFFREIDRDWRGWPDAKRWMSIGGNATLQARHDGVGHVLLELTLQQLGDEPPWSAGAVVRLDAGSLGHVVAALRRFRES